MNLPSTAKVNKFIPKTQFFNRSSLSTKLKQEFTNTIQKITWLYKIAEDTIGINKTDDVEEIQVFEIELKENIIPKNSLKIIDKAIPYPILFIFKYKDDIAYGISLKNSNYPENYYFSRWNENIEFDFTGVDLERVYQKIIKKFIKGIELDKQGFGDIIKTDEQIKLLTKELSQLENRIRSEKQFNKKVELNKIYINKKKDLEVLKK